MYLPPLVSVYIGNQTDHNGLEIQPLTLVLLMYIFSYTHCDPSQMIQSKSNGPIKVFFA